MEDTTLIKEEDLPDKDEAGFVLAIAVATGHGLTLPIEMQVVIVRALRSYHTMRQVSRRNRKAKERWRRLNWGTAAEEPAAASGDDETKSR